MRPADQFFYLELLLGLTIGLIVVAAVVWSFDLRSFSHVLLGASVVVLAVVLIFRPPPRSDRWRQLTQRNRSGRIATQSIYVRLLDDGKAGLRPIDAIHLHDDLYLIPPDTVLPFRERWEFTPGTVVKCETRALNGGKGLVAVEGVSH